jgi:hypothetical protein
MPSRIPKAERRCLPLQGSGLAKDDPVVKDAWISTGAQDRNQIQGDNNDWCECHLEN